MKNVEIEWDLILILTIVCVFTIALTMLAAEGMRWETNKYLGYCIAEGHAESYCMMRWIELKKVGNCDREQSTIRHRYLEG